MKTKLLRLSYIALLFLHLADSVHAESPPVDSITVKVAVYSMDPGEPLFFRTDETEFAELKTFSASVSDPVEVKPPLFLSTDKDAANPIRWVPQGSDQAEWVLVIGKDTNGHSQSIAFPAGKADLPASSLILGNMTPHAVVTNYRTSKQTVAPYSAESLQLESNRLAIEANSLELPYQLTVSVEGLDTDSRYILLIGPPHVRGSAIMTHRLIKLPTNLYDNKLEFNQNP